MENKETLIETIQQSQVLENAEYYKYIFKKTEKIVCAVFFITRSDENIGHKDHLIIDLEKCAQETLETVLTSLSADVRMLEQQAMRVRYALMRLETALRIATAARLVREDHFDVFIHEIDSVYRTLRQYTSPKKVGVVGAGYIVPQTTRKAPHTRTIPDSHTETSRTSMPSVTVPSRRERVMTVLRDKGEATIKDIVEVVTDCSEKTIQRELTSLIKDNIVHREGDRRWSKYSII